MNEIKITNEVELKTRLNAGESVSRFSTDVTIDGADLTGADLTGANLRSAYLTGANLTDANLTGANLTGADLTGADLTGADLRGAYLTGADLTGANLTGADLTGADLRGADLTGANLTGADLTGANLTGADLTGADLTGADLRGADLRGANLNWNSHDLLAARLRQAAGGDYLLRLAAGFILVSRDMCHEQLLKHAPRIEHPEHGTVMAWALRQMAQWRTEDDGFPLILEKAIAALDNTKTDEVDS